MDKGSDKLIQLQVLRNFSSVPIPIVHHCQNYAISGLPAIISGSTWGDTIPEQHWTKQRTISKPELQLRVWRYSICAIVAADIFVDNNISTPSEYDADEVDYPALEVDYPYQAGNQVDYIFL